MGRVGVEPTQYLYRRILSPLRLPIPPSPRSSVVVRNCNACGLYVKSLTSFLHGILNVEFCTAESAENAEKVIKIFARFAVKGFSCGTLGKPSKNFEKTIVLLVRQVECRL